MVEADGADRREGAQIVFVGRVIAVPRHHVDRRMRQRGLEQRAAPFHVEFGRRVLVLIGRDRREEVARIGEAIGADRPALRQREGAAVILAEIAARGAVRNLDAEFHAARDHGDLAGLDVDAAEFGDEAQIALLRHEHHLAVGIVEMLIDHRFGDEIDMRGHAGLACWRRPPWSWSARPAGRSCPPSGSAPDPSAIARSHDLLLMARRGAPQPGIDLGKAAGMLHRRADAIEPGALVAAARRGEGRAGQLLGIEPVGAALRRVAPDRQRAGQAPRSQSCCRSRTCSPA